jgi:hypothetical protein
MSSQCARNPWPDVTYCPGRRPSAWRHDRESPGYARRSAGSREGNRSRPTNFGTRPSSTPRGEVRPSPWSSARKRFVFVGPITESLAERSIDNTRTSRSSTRSAASSPLLAPESAASAPAAHPAPRGTTPEHARGSPDALLAEPVPYPYPPGAPRSSSGDAPAQAAHACGDTAEPEGSDRTSRSHSAHEIAECSTRNRPDSTDTVAPAAAHRANAVCTTAGVNRSTWHRLSPSARRLRMTPSCERNVVGLH